MSRLINIFGGRANFQLTSGRMEVIRQARIQGTLSALPIFTERFNGTIPEVGGNIHLWAPRVAGGEPPFGHPPPGGAMPWEPLHRYPREGIYSDDFWEEQGTDAEGSMGGPIQLTDSDAGGSDDDFNMARPEAGA